MDKGKMFSKELKVGLLGILALLIIYLLINFFKGIDVFKDGEKYYVKFNNIGEIVNASPVFLNGYKVGNVSNIIYDFKRREGVVVEIDIDNRLDIPADSHAEVNNKMLGSSTISLKLGTGKTLLAAGDTLNGYLNGGAMEEAAEMIPKVAAMMPKIDSVLVSLNTILANPAIGNSVNNIEELTKQLNGTTARLNTLMSNEVPDVADKIVQIEDDILKITSQLSEKDFALLFESLEKSVANIEEITAKLNNGNGTAGMLLNDSALYNRLNSTCDAAKSLLEDLKQNPKRYVNFSLFGRKDKKQNP